MKMIGFENKKGFTITEILFVVVISVIIIGTVLASWIFVYKNWTSQNEVARLRIDLMKALEIMKEDLRLSSITFMVYYPSGAEPFQAISLPTAEPDANGFLPMNVNGDIDWEETVIYHTFTDDDGNTTLRRTVFDPRDNTMDDTDRYNQLVDVVTNGVGGSGSTTDTEFLTDIEIFDITTISPIIDFYQDSADPVRVGKIIFGWVNLSAGSHTFRFEVTGKNDSSTGYDLGVDSILVEPAGSFREAEYYASTYAPSGSLTLSGGTASRVHGATWGNDNFLEFTSGGIGSYTEISDYYDLWRESSFDNAALNSCEKVQEEVRVQLTVPEDADEGSVAWNSYVEAETTDVDGEDNSLPGSLPVTLRTVVRAENITSEGDIIKVGFRSHSGYDLVINRAYITKRDSGPNGLANQNPSGLEVEEYHRHQQLFFKDPSGDIQEGVTIPAGSEVFSVWTAYPLELGSDYLISFFVPDTSDDFCRYWQAPWGTIRTYYIQHPASGEYYQAGMPDWSSESYVMDDEVYVTTGIHVSHSHGTVESQVFDTTLSSPAYNQIGWSESVPSGSDIVMKGRSSNDPEMTGAAAWSAITGSSSNPNSPSMGAARYAQFYAELTGGVSWESNGSTLSYENYILDQLSGFVYEFPESGGDHYVTEIAAPWLDDVQIDWPGADKMCAITGYIARKNSYGQAELFVDGIKLKKILGVHLKVSSDMHGRTIEQENHIEIEPRNTGK